MKFKVFSIILLGILLCAGCAPSAPASSPSSSPVTVITDSGNADKITVDFDVSSCLNGKLEYSGEQIDPDVDSAWVNFRIYDVEISDYSIETSGPHDLIPTGSGSSRVSLDPGTYYIEAENWNSNWEVSVICR